MWRLSGPAVHAGVVLYVAVSNPRIHPPRGSVCWADGAGDPVGATESVSKLVSQPSSVPQRTSTESVPAASVAGMVTVDQEFAVVGVAVTVWRSRPLTRTS